MKFVKYLSILGFSEILGNMTQSSFWNFDALFTPQDHPARELQDTFYLEKFRIKNPASEQIKKYLHLIKKIGNMIGN